MPIKVAIVSSEVIPFAKTGGLADVAGALPLALQKAGCEACVFMPFYREVVIKNLKVEPTGVIVNIPIGKRVIKGEIFKTHTGGVPVYLVKRDEFYDRSYLYTAPDGDYFDNLERFTFFSRAVLEAMPALGIMPDVIHLNDWQSALIAPYVKTIYSRHYQQAATLFTIHNLAYQGVFNPSLYDITGLPWDMYNMHGLEFYGQVNLLKAGIVYSDIVTTVSEAYAREIQTEEYGCGLEKTIEKRKDSLYGILNGVDYAIWDPSHDEFLPEPYSADALKGKAVSKKALIKEYKLKIKQSTPLIGIISRLADQKGFDILSEAMEAIMSMDVGMVVLGSGEKKYQKLFEDLSLKYPGRLGVKIAFDNKLSHLIEAGSDFFLMPSRYEPCGLNQIYSLRYGTVPIVRATGGLDDTIKDYSEGGNGFKFSEYAASALIKKIEDALEAYSDKKAFEALRKKGMLEDFSWERSARRYIELYEIAVMNVRGELPK